MEMDDPGLLFHYTGLKTALEHILFNAQIKLGPFRLTNDPREARSWEFTLMSQEKSPAEMFPLDELYDLSRIAGDKVIKHGVKVLCLTKNLPDGSGYGRPRMWSQYGGRHEGVCLVFDRYKLTSSIYQFLRDEQTFHDSVRYSDLCEYDAGHFDLDLNDIKERGFIEVLRERRVRFYHDFFFRKHLDWRDEAEYRWICIADDDEARFVGCRHALIAVIVGVDFPAAYESCLKPMCEHLGVYAGRMRWKNGHPRHPLWEIHKPR